MKILNAKKIDFDSLQKGRVYRFKCLDSFGKVHNTSEPMRLVGKGKRQLWCTPVTNHYYDNRIYQKIDVSSIKEILFIEEDATCLMN